MESKRAHETMDSSRALSPLTKLNFFKLLLLVVLRYLLRLACLNNNKSNLFLCVLASALNKPTKLLEALLPPLLLLFFPLLILPSLLLLY